MFRHLVLTALICLYNPASATTICPTSAGVNSTSRLGNGTSTLGPTGTGSANTTTWLGTGTSTLTPTTGSYNTTSCLGNGTTTVRPTGTGSFNTTSCLGNRTTTLGPTGTGSFNTTSHLNNATSTLKPTGSGSLSTISSTRRSCPPLNTTATVSLNTTSTVKRTCPLSSTTETFTEYSFVTIGTSTRTEYLQSTPPPTIVNLATVTPTDGTATVTRATAIAFTGVPGTRTVYLDDYVVTTVGVDTTKIVPTPPGFVPVQSSLPNATYGFIVVVAPCNVTTFTSISTTTLSISPVSYVILSGTVLYNPADSKYTSASDFTDFSIVWGTSTFTETTFSATEYSTVRTYTTTATPTTIYEACATNNFAGQILYEDYSYDRLYDVDVGAAGSYVEQHDDAPYDPHSCCVAAMDAGARAWAYKYQEACYFIDGTNPGCTPTAVNSTVVYGPSPSDELIVVGNGVDGRIEKAKYSPYPGWG